jgi:hypothetical protein
MNVDSKLIQNLKEVFNKLKKEKYEKNRSGY